MVSFYILTMVKKGQYNVSMVLFQHNWQTKGTVLLVTTY